PASRPRICALCFLFMIAPPPTPTLFPYTTLFRSYRKKKNCWRQDIRKGEYLTGCLGAVGAAVLTALLFYRSTVAALVLLLPVGRSEEHTSELQSRFDLVCRLLLEKKKPTLIARRR